MLACFPVGESLVTSLAVLGRPQLIHLLDALLEFEILTLFIRVAFILHPGQLAHSKPWRTSGFAVAPSVAYLALPR